MNVVSTSVSPRDHRVAPLLALVALACCAVILLAVVALAAFGVDPLPEPDLRLAPFRWTPLSTRLA